MSVDIAPGMGRSLLDRIWEDVLLEGTARAAAGKDITRSEIDEYQPRIADFIEQDLGFNMWPVQQDIADSVDDNPMTTVRSCHAAGKSATAARIALGFLHTRKHSIVITTAPTARQVQNVLWRYINTAANGSNVPLLGRNLTVRYEIASDWYAIGFTGDTNGGSTMQGFHAAEILLIVDEAAGVAETVFDEAESILTGSGARALYIGNPTSLSGTFRSSFHETGDLYTGIRISAYDTPNFQTFGVTREDMLSGEWERKIEGQQMPYPALIDPRWVNRQIRRHGIDSPYVISRIDAEFPTDTGSTLIALSWIERANNNAGTLHDPDGERYAGIDVARFGEDETSIALRQGDELGPQDSWNGAKITESEGRCHYWLTQHGYTQENTKELRVDDTGVGGGLADNLEARGWRVRRVSVGSSSSNKSKWPNLRHELWWQLRDRFHDDRIAPMEAGRYTDYDGTVDDIAQSQLSDVKFRYDATGKYSMPLIERKEEAAKRGVRSPDRAEAIMLAFGEYPRGEGRASYRVKKATGKW